MPRIPVLPSVIKASFTTQNVLQSIYDTAGEAYQTATGINPKDINGLVSLSALGDNIMGNKWAMNTFLDHLVNKIARNFIEYRSYSNPLAPLKRGIMEFGEITEEFFVNITESVQYDPEKAETDLYKRHKPDVRTDYHSVNFQKYYPYTIELALLKQAFTSWDGMNNLIDTIAARQADAMNYDEFMVTKYMIGQLILNDHFKEVPIATITAANSNANLSTIKETSNNIGFMSTEYNKAGVYNHCPPAEQILLTTSKFDSIMSVESLASAFNVEYRTFKARNIVLDSLVNLDEPRLEHLFADNDDYVPLTSEQKTELAKVQALDISPNSLILLDNLLETQVTNNGRGLYTNTDLHAWKTFSASKFACGAAFVSA